MKYMLLIYLDEQALSETEREQCYGESARLAHELNSSGQYLAADKDVSVAGGANIIQQYLSAGLLAEIQIHLVPVLLGEGIRLFEHTGLKQIELERTRVIESRGVRHLSFRVLT